MAQTCEGPPRGWGCADGPEVDCFGGEQSPDSAPAQKQAQNLVRRFGVRRDHLRLVPPAPPPRPRRLEIRISVAAADGRTPVGRTRPLRLRESDLQELIDHAARMEQR